MQRSDNSRLKALFKLMETETDQYGPLLKQALASAIRANPDEVQRTLQEEFRTAAPRNVLHMLEEICWEDLTQALAAFNAKINPDLDEGLLLLAKFTSPTSARGAIAQPLQNMAQELRPALVNAVDYSEIIRILSHYIFEMSGFEVISTITDVQILSFPRFLKTRKGSALCLACLYICLGQHFGLEMDVVDLAGKLLVHLRDPQHATSFLIDPLDKGKALREEDCRKYIQARGFAEEPNLFTPLSSRLIIRRFIANMIFVLNKIHDERRLKFLRSYLEIMKS